MDGFNIKSIREKLGLTQEELAQKIGVSRNTVINYEKGGVIPESKRQLLNSLLEMPMLNTGMDHPGDKGYYEIKKESTDNTILGNPAQINKSESIEIPLSVWNVIELQAKSLEKRDSQIDELIKMLKDQKGVAAGAKGVAPGGAHG